MEINFIVAILFFLSFLANNANADDPVIFDIRKYGAGSGDISQALSDAWKAACDSPTPSVVLIPPGTWHLSQVRLVGPNKAPLELQVQGTVQADPDIKNLPNKDGQWITLNYIDGFTLSGGGVFDGQGQLAWKGNDCGTNPNCPKTPINLSFNYIKNAVIRDITSKDSKNWHTNCISSQNVTFLRVTISAPGDSINTDGIHLARNKGVNVIDSIIGTGDDCISIGDDTTDLHIQNVTCGPGHGISIGSLGKNVAEKDVQGVYVQNCTFKGTDNGVRIKTWPSAPATLEISDLHFEDLIMDNVRNPIIFDQEYCPYNLCQKEKASLIKISKVTVKNIKGTSATQEVISFLCSSAKPCENIEVGDVDLTYTGTPAGPATTKCDNIKPTLVGKQNPPICATPAQSA